MTTRLATRDDLPSILDIANWAIRETTSNFRIEPPSLADLTEAWTGTHEEYPWLVADEGGAVAAYAYAAPHKPRAAYRWTAEVSIYVLPHHQGKGLGRALYARLLPMLEAQGFRTLVAAIALPNPASVRLHEAFGFTHAGTLQRAGWKFGRWIDVGYWQRCLPGDPVDGRPPLPVRDADAR